MHVIRDSEDLSEQAQDCKTPTSVAACLVAQATGDPAFNPGGATRTHRDDATPSKRLLPLRPEGLSSLGYHLQAPSPTFALLRTFSMQGARLASRPLRLADV